MPVVVAGDVVWLAGVVTWLSRGRDGDVVVAGRGGAATWGRVFVVQRGAPHSLHSWGPHALLVAFPPDPHGPHASSTP